MPAETAETIEVRLNDSSLRQLKEDGNKADFSGFIGHRWEELICVPTLADFVSDPERARFAFGLAEGHEIAAFILLDSDGEIKRQVGSKKIPDSLIVETDPNDRNHLTIRACDFKFALDWAEYPQVSPKTLIELLNKSPSAKDHLKSTVDDLVRRGRLNEGIVILNDVPANQPKDKPLTIDANGKVVMETGRFISPNTEENRDYFSKPTSRIKRAVVYIRELRDTEVATLLAGHPGSELDPEAQRLSFGEPTSNLDKPLMAARATAAMKSLGFRKAEELQARLEAIK